MKVNTRNGFRLITPIDNRYFNYSFKQVKDFVVCDSGKNSNWSQLNNRANGNSYGANGNESGTNLISAVNQWLFIAFVIFEVFL